jgi:hypothetical protein
MAREEVLPGHARVLDQGAYEMEIFGLTPSDRIFVSYQSLKDGDEDLSNLDTFEAPLEELEGTFLFNPSRNLVQIALNKVPSHTQDFSFQVLTFEPSSISWDLTGLEKVDRDGTPRVWSIRQRPVTASTKMTFLSLGRSPETGEWEFEVPELSASSGSVTATKPLQEVAPEVRVQTVIAQKSGSYGSATEFEVIFDITDITRRLLLDTPKVSSILTAVQGMSAGLAQRPVDVSYGGSVNYSLAVADDATDAHNLVSHKVASLPQTYLDDLLEQRSQVAPVGTVFFVICSGSTYIQQALKDNLSAKQQQIRFLQLGNQTLPEFDSPALSAQIFDPAQEFIGQLKPLN